MLLLLAAPAFCDVQLPKIFGDNMVLQRDKDINIWGWANPKEKVTVQLNKQSKIVITGKDGKWKLSLAAEAAGGPYQLIVKGKNTITINNVLIGDVWICSGQSNMEWTLQNTNNATEEIRQANYPSIRHFEVPKSVATEPQKDLKGGSWKVATPENAWSFTAVGYFFARELTKELNVPIGLLHTSWGGTHSETWTSKEAFQGSDEFKEMIASMPAINIDSLAKQKATATLKRIEQLQGPIDVPASAIKNYKEISFDDSQWKTMTAPGAWEGQSLGDFDGIVWYRKSFDISAVEAGKEATIELAMVDDIDISFVNGQEIGRTNGYNVKRSYRIPAGILKAGSNVVAVRVEDTGGGGGIHGDKSQMKIIIGNSERSLAGTWRFRVESLAKGALSIGPNSYPTLLFNAMISPVTPLAIKGVIWYQGESNAWRGYQYRKAFPLMITDWRKHWRQGDFPFYFVQLASYNAGSKNGSNWAELREAQTQTLSLPNTGMAVTSDIGEPNDIHPRNKQDVGKRLAAIALNRTYAKPRVDSGPMYKSMEVKDDKIILTFTDTGGGLITKDKYGYRKGFEIAGENQKFQFAKAYIEGNTVVVYHDNIKNPVAVRFGWADDASENNLFNVEGFPAIPFRTDTWKGITEEAKYQIGN